MKNKKIHDFLKNHPLGVLSTASKNGTPWGSAVYYVADEDFTFYFVTRAGSQKYKNITENKTVALTVVDGVSQITVQVAGTVSKLPVKDYQTIVFDKLARIKPAHTHAWTPPVIKLHGGDFMPLRLIPKRLQYADYKTHQTKVSDTYIETVISG